MFTDLFMRVKSKQRLCQKAIFQNSFIKTLFERKAISYFKYSQTLGKIIIILFLISFNFVCVFVCSITSFPLVCVLPKSNNDSFQNFCCVGILCSQWTSVFDFSKCVIIYPTNLKCLNPLRIKLSWSTHANIFVRPCYPFNHVYWCKSKTSFFLNFTFTRCPSNKWHFTRQKDFHNIKYFSNINLEVKETRYFQRT